MFTQVDDVSGAVRFNRLSDVLREPHCWRLPIEGYEKMPVVSLQMAIEPLLHIVRDVKRKALVAEQICKQPADGLTPDESSSIMLYTMEWEPHDQCLYASLNKCLRDKQRQSLKPWFLFLKLFLTALDKLPTVSGTVFRGVKLNMLDKYQAQSNSIWWGFSSCTGNLNILKSEKFLGTTGERTLFFIECHSGKNICRHSYYQHENEILLPPARYFEVVGSLEQDNGLYVIHLREAKPPVVLIEPVSEEDDPSLPISVNHVQVSLSNSHQNLKLKSKINTYQQSTRVNLTFEELIDEDMLVIAEELIIAKACPELNLSNNRITSKGVSVLASALQKNTTLKVLSLLNNHVSDQGVRSLAESLSIYNTSLTILGLGSNDITDEGVKYIAQLLRTNRSLITLTLQTNQISSRGVELLMDTLARFNNTLVTLNISSNILINDSCVDSIIRMLASNKTLKEFYIIKCSLSPASIEKIRQAARAKHGLDLLI